MLVDAMEEHNTELSIEVARSGVSCVFYSPVHLLEHLRTDMLVKPSLEMSSLIICVASF